MPLFGLRHLIVPVISIALMLLACGYFIQRNSRFYRDLLANEANSVRSHSVDGLRGFLAIGVFFCHAVANYHFYQDQNWSTDGSRLGGLSGSIGVSCFFLITAFLFWSRALASDGRLDIQQFFVSRVRRIVPMYFTICAIIVVISLVATDFKLVMPLRDIAKDIVAWLSFTALGRPLINGYGLTQVIDPVYWTLFYEWRFYLFFPLFVLCARGWKSIIILPISAVVIHWYRDHPLEWYFLYGAVAATIIHRWPSVKKICSSPYATLLALGALAYVLHVAETAYDARIAPVLSIFFFLIAGGNTIFGVLTSRAARFLGSISYSIYLLHAISIFVVFRAITWVTPVASLSILKYWLVISACGVATVLASAATYRFIEYPFAIGYRKKSRISGATASEVAALPTR